MHSPTTTRRRTVDPPFPFVDPDDDRERFAALYARHRDELARYCRTILRHDQDVEDALQSTMAKAFAALRTETREIALRPWLFRIAHNEAISIVRRRVDAVELDERDGGDPDPVARTVETRERLRLLQEDLRDLPTRQRSALVLRELNGLAHREIADVLRTSPSAVKQAIYEARCGLGDCAEGRSLACDAVRRALSDGDGRTTGRRRLRAHLRSCRSCRAFDAALRQRPQDLGALFPAWPAVGLGGVTAGLSGLLSGAGGGAAVGVGSTTVGLGATGSGGTLLGGGLAAAGATKLATIAAVAVVAGGGAVAVERGTFAPSGSGTETNAATAREAATSAPPTMRITASSGNALVPLPPAAVGARTTSSTGAPKPSNHDGASPGKKHAASSDRRAHGTGTPKSAGSPAPSSRDRSGRDVRRDRGPGQAQGRQPTGPPSHAAADSPAKPASRDPRATGPNARSGSKKPGTASASAEHATGQGSGAATSSGGASGAPPAATGGNGAPPHAASVGASVAGSQTTRASGKAVSPSGAPSNGERSPN